MGHLCSTLFGLALVARVAGAQAAAPPLRIPFEKYRLDNGLTVILHEDHRTPQVVVDLWFRVGSKDEPPRRTGFAHLFEHLMFMGTSAVPTGQFDAIMETEGGSNNASTSEDRTNYFESGPSNLLETFLWLEGDRLATLPEAMTPAKVDLQRDVVKNERRQTSENRPYGKLELVLPEHMFPPEHPYHHPVIGSHEDLSAAQVDDVKAFFRSYYVASNATLVVAGDFAPAQAKAWIAKYLGGLARLPAPTIASPAPVRLSRSETVVVPDAVQLERAVLAWHAPPAFATGETEAQVLAGVLGGGRSSRLYQKLVYEQKLAVELEVEQVPMQYGGLFLIVVTAQAGHTAAELDKAVLDEIGRLQAAPPTPAEVARERVKLQTETLRRLDRLFGVAEALARYEFYLQDPGALARRELGRFEMVTPAGVAAQARSILGAPHVSIHFVPNTTPNSSGGR